MTQPSPLRRDAHRILQAYAGQATVRDRFLELLALPTDPTRRDHAGGHVTASVMVVNASLDRVLLCLHRRINRWVQLGGHCEDGDTTLADAAIREAREESGLGNLVVHPDPIDLDVHPVTCRYGPSHHYDVRFAAIAPAGAQITVSDESHDLGWFTPDALPHPLANATERLVEPALAVARRLVG